MLSQGHPSVTLRLLTTFYKTHLHMAHIISIQHLKGERDHKKRCAEIALLPVFSYFLLYCLFSVSTFLYYSVMAIWTLFLSFFLNALRM